MTQQKTVTTTTTTTTGNRFGGAGWWSGRRRNRNDTDDNNGVERELVTTLAPGGSAKGGEVGGGGEKAAERGSGAGESPRAGTSPPGRRRHGWQVLSPSSSTRSLLSEEEVKIKVVALGVGNKEMGEKQPSPLAAVWAIVQAYAIVALVCTVYNTVFGKRGRPLQGARRSAGECALCARVGRSPASFLLSTQDKKRKKKKSARGGDPLSLVALTPPLSHPRNFEWGQFRAPGAASSLACAPPPLTARRGSGEKGNVGYDVNARLGLFQPVPLRAARAHGRDLSPARARVGMVFFNPQFDTRRPGKKK